MTISLSFLIINFSIRYDSCDFSFPFLKVLVKFDLISACPYYPILELCRANFEFIYCTFKHFTLIFPELFYS